MGICDAKYSFIWVSVGSYGRDNDASIFGQSSFFKQADMGVLKVPMPSDVNGYTLPYVLLGDDIFPLKTWLVKPYGGTKLTEEEEVANYRISRGRRTIENTFGVMAARWRIFRRPIRANIDTVDRVVKAVVCLHNFLMQTDNAHYLPNGFVDSYNNAEFKEGEWRTIVGEDETGLQNVRRVGSNNYKASARETRDKFKDYFSSAEGAVAWQLDVVRNCGPLAS
ncbi:protein ALP1-like [Anneissia japonica]|uniref:protein ALP1-like n=1 Tax=Anneissia japonica TaxID=1529436 RepID=UPI0014259741|nr:protein ALP1-like [Anneissia japonica]